MPVPDLSTNQVNAESKPDIQRPVMAGFLTIALFVGGFVGWSTYAPLDSAAIAQGYVAVEKGRQTIAHLEGGIIGELLVSDGSKVEVGQLLVRLTDANASATFDLLSGRLVAARALEARLLAEHQKHDQITFSKALNERRTESVIGEILSGQEGIFTTRQAGQKNRKAILQQRTEQLQEEISGLKGQIKSEASQLILIREEITMVDKMVKKGFTEKPRLLQLKRRAHDIDGRRSLHESQVAKARQSIGETKLRIFELETNHMNEVAEQLRTTRADIYDLTERLRAAEDVHNRTDIISPISGTVVGLKVHTKGGVVRPGEPLMNIVPANEQLVVEARVNPADIDVVHIGTQAKVRLTAFSQRTILPTAGQVESISADHLVDEATGETYYLAKIALDKSDLDQTNKQQIRPGMEAEVMIITGERTFVEYMLEPITNSLGRAFRET
ncbi:HlyD family type I secretion periplasmic adaptor subunit [Pseudomonadota bacterium]